MQVDRHFFYLWQLDSVAINREANQSLSSRKASTSAGSPFLRRKETGEVRKEIRFFLPSLLYPRFSSGTARDLSLPGPLKS